MFGSIGIMEIMIIAAVGLMVLGPEKFPEVARMFARLVKDVRGYVDEAKTEISKEIRPVQDELRKVGQADAREYIERIVDVEDQDDSPPNPEPEGPDPDYENFYNPYMDEYPGMDDTRTESGDTPTIPEQQEAGDSSSGDQVEYGASPEGEEAESGAAADDEEGKPLDG